MEEYEFTRALAACEVDVGLLQEFESYINEELGKSDDSDGAPGLVTTLMSGPSGAQTFNKSKDGNKLKDDDKAAIPEGVSNIALVMQGEASANRVELSFDEKRSKTFLHVKLAGDSAKQRALGIARYIENKLEQRKAITRFVHSALGYPLFVVFGVLPAGYLARDIIGAFSGLDAVFTVFASTVYTMILVFLIRQFVPYCVFDSQFNRKVGAIAGYVAYGGMAIFGVMVMAVLWVIFVQGPAG